MTRAQVFSVRMSPEMQEKIRARAAELGCSVSEYVRWLVLADLAKERS